MKLSVLLQGFTTVNQSQEREISGISLDSRKVNSGNLFVALLGTQTSGLNYVEHAVKNGAAAVVFEVAEDKSLISQDMLSDYDVPTFEITDLRNRLGVIANRFFDSASAKISLVGITGTNGKTSCSHFLSQTLYRDAPCGVIGTIGWGVHGDLQPAQCTTPDVLTLHSMIYSLQQKGVRTIVMEVSSHALDQKRIAGLDIDIAVFTNLSRDHLDYHNDMAGYSAAKNRLFELQCIDCAVINFDDDFGREIVKKLQPRIKVIGFGFKEEYAPQILGSNLKLNSSGFSMDVKSTWGSGTISSSLLGAFNASNLLAVLGCNMALKKPFQNTLRRLDGVSNVAGRMQRFGGAQNKPLVVVDYAHTPDALTHVLQTLRSHNPCSLIVVFGCGGDRDRGKRALMGATAEELSDHIIVTDDNPRSESPQTIIDDIIAGIKLKHEVEIIHDRKLAIKRALEVSQANDIILIAGKGHEDYQIYGKDKHYFSDAAVVESLLH